MTLNDLVIIIPGRDAHHLFGLYVNNVDLLPNLCFLAKAVKEG